MRNKAEGMADEKDTIYNSGINTLWRIWLIATSKWLFWYSIQEQVDLTTSHQHCIGLPLEKLSRTHTPCRACIQEKEEEGTELHMLNFSF